MEQTIVKCADALLDKGEDFNNDSGRVVALCTVKGAGQFNEIAAFTLKNKGKKLSNAKQEELGLKLSSIIFYASALVHTLGLDTSKFELDDLTSFSQEYPDIYQQDVVLCSMSGAKSFTDVLEGYFEEEDIMLSTEEAEEVTGAEGEGMILSMGQDSDEDDEFDFDPEAALAEVYACVIILCDHFNLDLEVVMENSLSITPFDE